MPAMRKKSLSSMIMDKLAARTCGICSKILNRSGDVKRHIDSTHDKLRPYGCQYCDKHFAQESGRNIHQNSHTGAKPYFCMFCTMRFNDPSCRGRHRTKQHGNITQCPKCSESFNNFKELTHHIDFKHTSKSKKLNTLRGSRSKHRRSMALSRRISSFSLSLSAAGSTRRRSLAPRHGKVTVPAPQLQLTDVDGKSSSAFDNHANSIQTQSRVPSRSPSPFASSNFTSDPFARANHQSSASGHSRSTPDMVLESPRGTRFDHSAYYYSSSRYSSPIPSREHSRTPEPVHYPSQPEFAPPPSNAPLSFDHATSSTLAPALFPSLATRAASPHTPQYFTPPSDPVALPLSYGFLTPPADISEWDSLGWGAHGSTLALPAQQPAVPSAPSSAPTFDAYPAYVAAYLDSITQSPFSATSYASAIGNVKFDYDLMLDDPHQPSFRLSSGLIAEQNSLTDHGGLDISYLFSNP